MKLKILPWIFFAFFAIVIGLYPLLYYLVDMKSQGLLSQKPRELLNSNIWSTAFYIHITFGGIALLTGWTQFSQRLRNKYLNTHRLIGKVYVVSVFLSSISGLFISFFATGGIVSVLGFALLAMFWFVTVAMAYISILKGDIIQHQKWMIRNYALTFAAVTLRIWLPLMAGFVFHDFIVAYRIVAWLCWIPNLIVAELIIRKMLVKANYAAQTV